MWLRIAATGLGGGVFSGLAGIGGGTFMVPLMVSLLSVSQVVAHGTSLAIVVPTALASLLGYTFSVQIDWVLVAVATIPSIATAPLGARSASAMPELGLRRAFAGFLMVAALLLLLLADPEELFAFAEMGRYLVAVVIGLLAGFFERPAGSRRRHIRRPHDGVLALNGAARRAGVCAGDDDSDLDCGDDRTRASGKRPLALGGRNCAFFGADRIGVRHPGGWLDRPAGPALRVCRAADLLLNADVRHPDLVAPAHSRQGSTAIIAHMP